MPQLQIRVRQQRRAASCRIHDLDAAGLLAHFHLGQRSELPRLDEHVNAFTLVRVLHAPDKSPVKLGQVVQQPFPADHAVHVLFVFF